MSDRHTKAPPADETEGAKNTSGQAAETHREDTSDGGESKPPRLHVPARYAGGPFRFRVESVQLFAEAVGAPGPIPSTIDAADIGAVVNLKAAQNGQMWFAAVGQRLGWQLADRLGDVVCVRLMPAASPMLPLAVRLADAGLTGDVSVGGGR